MLLGLESVPLEGFALFDLGQPGGGFTFAFLFIVVVLGFFIDREETVELEHRTGHAQLVVTGSDVNAGLVENGGLHLRPDKALPDEIVEFELVFLQVLFYRVRRVKNGSGANSLVGVLCALLGLIGSGLVRQVVGAEPLGDKFSQFLHGLIADAGRVGAHVGNQTDRALFAQLDAFIEPLRQRHGALDTEAKLARRVLLQGAGDKRGNRVAPPLLARDGGDVVDRLLQRGHVLVRFLLVGNEKFFAVVFDEPGVENRRLGGGEIGGNGPVLFLLELADFAFPFHYQPQGNGLNAPGGESPLDLVPKNRADLITDQPVEHAAGLLRVHAIGVNGPGMLESLLHRALGNFIHGDAENLFGADHGFPRGLFDRCLFSGFLGG